MGYPAISLYELNHLVAVAISSTLPSCYWVEAELSEAREASAGHCYMELIEKDERSNTPIAKARAACWRNCWQMLKPKFESVTGQTIHSGMKVMLLVHPQFHENYGFSWIVDDIDPTYTVGEMARKRQEIVDALKREGVFELQKGLALPMFCQRIAVISSATAAGYGDFCNQLSGNGYGLQFDARLFPAIMQGEGVQESVIHALDAIRNEQEQWHCVVIIRGGGATSDLSGFDTLALAESVAKFPLPIITGIGHDRDESVLDMVSFYQVKTPTAAADFLIDHLAEVLHRVHDAQRRIVDSVKHRLEMEHLRLDRLAAGFASTFSLAKTRQAARLDRLMGRLGSACQGYMLTACNHLDRLAASLRPATERRMVSESHRLQMLQQRIKAQDPELLLSRGYSITLKDGKVVRSANGLQAGDEIESILAEGKVKAIVK